MKKMIMLMTTLFILSGCVNGDRYNFSGSSENWDVFYIVEVQNRDEQNETGTIKYTGQEPVPEKIDYTIKYTAGGAYGTGKTLDDGETNTGRSSCQGCAVIQEDDEIEVEITWNGQTEKLTLTNDN